jgi:predicted MPP superfamily phosphohydrolase
VRILHVSDLHASSEAVYDQGRIAKALLGDVSSQHKRAPIDCVVFSGDLAKRGLEAEFLIGHELVIQPILGVLGLGADRLIIVPGNHDIDRQKITGWEESGLVASLTDEAAVTRLLSNKDEFLRVTKRLDAWREYYDFLYEDHTPTQVGTCARLQKIELDGLSVGALAVTSSWRSASDEDDRHLLIGEYQVADALDELSSDAFTIVVSHHPLDWLTRFDQKVVRRLLERHRILFMCGHTHEAQPSAEIRSGRVIFSQAGCLYEDTEYLNGYSIVNIADGQVTIEMRTWWPARGEFGKAENVAKEGVFTASWPESGLTVRSTPEPGVLYALADVVEQSSFLEVPSTEAEPTMLDDLLVEPRFLPLAYKDAVAAKQVQDDFAVDEVEPWNPGWVDAQVVVVAGEQESGVSSALLWLAGDRYSREASLLPVYVPFEPLFNGRGLTRALESAALQSGWSRAQGTLPSMLIACDDVTADGRGITTLLEYLQEHPEHRLVIGCREEDGGGIGEALRRCDMTFTRTFLGPFRRHQLRELVEKVAGPTEMTERVFEVVESQGLPRSPFILTALTAVMVGAGADEVTTLNESDLLDAYVTMLLSRDAGPHDKPVEMDHRHREHLLGSLAEHFTTQEIHSLMRLDAEEYFAQWFRAKGWDPGASPGNVLDDLIRRKLLAQDGNRNVGFRQPALQHLFAAKRLIEDVGFMQIILEDPLANSSVIAHAAGLQRSSRPLLLALVGATEDLVDGHLEDLSIFDKVTDEDGWTELKPSPEQLRHALRRDEPPDLPENVRDQDERLDALRDRWEQSPEEGLPKFAIEHGKLGNAVALLTEVLKSSELVDDVPLKKQALRVAIQGWALMTGYASAAGEGTALREFLEVNETQWDAEGMPREIENVMRLLLVVVMLVGVESDLGTPQLTAIIDEMFSESALLEQSATAMYATLLFFAVHEGAAVDRMRTLFEAYPDHPIIAVVVRAWAHSAYRREKDLTLRTKLENLLVDVYEAGRPRASGLALTERRNATAAAIREMRLKQLARDSMRAATLDPLEVQDEA